MANTRVLTAGHYFLAVEGVAIARRFTSEPEALGQRAAEIGHIVGAMDEFPQSLEVPLTEYGVEAGYTRWAPVYDGPNPAIACESPIVDQLLDELPGPGRALDAACGTGRHAATLADRGWDVVGIDTTPAMLDQARAKVLSARFLDGRLDDVPLEDHSVDLVICSLALTHVAHLAPVIAEFARVLAPGGHLITTDMHPVITTFSGSMAAFPVDDPDGPPLALHFVPNLHHEVSDYVNAMAAADLSIRRCVEPPVTEDMLDNFPSNAVYPEATREAYLDVPYQLIWLVEKR
jgi:ubiquinone/menaquinone biosynthesis C-methylase UbiE